MRRTLLLALMLHVSACKNPFAMKPHPCPGYDPRWQTDTVGWVIRANGDTAGPITVSYRCLTFGVTDDTTR